MYRLTGKIPKGAEAHHIFPHKYIDEFADIGIDVNKPKYGAWWEKFDHRSKASEYNTVWQRFLQTNPTKKQALKFGKKMGNRYGFKPNY